MCAQRGLFLVGLLQPEIVLGEGLCGLPASRVVLERPAWGVQSCCRVSGLLVRSGEGGRGCFTACRFCIANTAVGIPSAQQTPFGAGSLEQQG